MSRAWPEPCAALSLAECVYVCVYTLCVLRVSCMCGMCSALRMLHVMYRVPVRLSLYACSVVSLCHTHRNSFSSKP